MNNIFKKLLHRPVNIPNDYAFQDKSPVYLFTNENVAGYLRPINLQDARVLSIGASGDHAFEAYLAGAKHVDTFDINSWQKPVIELKTHMIRNLDYQKFVDFFFSQNHFFDMSMLNGIQSSFSPELRDFLAKYRSSSKDVLKYGTAQNSNYKICYLSYLADPAKYEKLSKVLPEQIPFRHCNLTDLSSQTSARYDFMMLSNVFEYLYQNSGIPDYAGRLMAYYNGVLDGLVQQNLTKEGAICFHYMWGANPVAWANYLGHFEDKEFYPATHDYNIKFDMLSVESMMTGPWDVALFLTQKSR